MFRCAWHARQLASACFGLACRSYWCSVQHCRWRLGNRLRALVWHPASAHGLQSATVGNVGLVRVAWYGTLAQLAPLAVNCAAAGHLTYMHTHHSIVINVATGHLTHAQTYTHTRTVTFTHPSIVACAASGHSKHTHLQSSLPPVGI